ncbi:MAG: histidinol-phosphate transaminase [Sphingomonadales bacterium]
MPIEAKKPQPKEGVMKIHAYVPGGSSIEGHDEVIKLASNESPLGPSPKVIEAISGGLDHLELYPDGGAEKLKAAIAETHGLDAAHIICGNGSEQLIAAIAQAYAGPGDEVVQSEFGFLAYGIATLAAGANLVMGGEDDYTTRVEALLAAVRHNTRILFLANPNNPTGTMIEEDELRWLRYKLPDRVLLVLDAAYAEYVEDENYIDGSALVAESITNGLENVAVLHTFSKIYGLAAMRLGWCYGPPSVIDAINRVRGAFNVSSLAQKAGIAALGDQAHVAEARAHNSRWLPRLSDALEGFGYEVPPSFGNFVLCLFPGGAEESVAVDKHLRDNGIIVRPVAGYQLPEALRITIGTDRQMETLLEVLGKFK